MNIFLIGPGSVGKSTVGKLLAEELNYHFVDIDLVFCDLIALIPDYINQHGYVAYCNTNSRLVDKLVEEHPNRTVFATPSGFLVHEESPELIEKHLRVIGNNAVSVLILPSANSLESADTIVARQLARYPEMNPSIERKRYIRRHGKYKKYGDVKVIGAYSPNEIVDMVTAALGSDNKPEPYT